MSKRASKKAGISPELLQAFDTLAGRAHKGAQDAEKYALENKPRSAFTAISEAATYASAARAILEDATPAEFDQFASYTYTREADFRAEYEEALAYGDLLEIGERGYAAMCGPADEALNYLSHLDVRM